MRIGQTSFIVLVSKLASSALGFAATLYFSRVLGAEVIGFYALALIVARWLTLVGDAGVSSAMIKRISEGTDPGEHFTAGLAAVAGLGIVSTISLLVFRDKVNAYVGAETATLIALLVVASLFSSVVLAGLRGDKLVHVAGLLSPVQMGTRSAIQIGLVFVGFGLSGMIVGYAVGGVIVGLVGLLILSIEVKLPRIKHFESLFDFAKFSWLGRLTGRSFNDVDVLVLGAFVSPGLIGVYSIAWNLTSFVGVFGSSIRQSAFPELSDASVRDLKAHIGHIVSDSLAYNGLFAIPALFGSLVLADRLLRIYGTEFVRGTEVLALLILSMLIWDYLNQLLNALNAMDRPDLSFRVNAVFITTNLVLNVVFVLAIGWVGAAIATVVSTTICLGLAFSFLYSLLDFEIPVWEFGRQVSAAAVMALLVFGTRELIERSEILTHNAAIVVLLVVLGAGTYFAVLTVISDRFRGTLVDNLPVRLPFRS